jgi:hypothetical protein
MSGLYLIIEVQLVIRETKHSGSEHDWTHLYQNAENTCGTIVWSLIKLRLRWMRATLGTMCTPGSHSVSVNNMNGDQEWPVNFTSSLAYQVGSSPSSDRPGERLAYHAMRQQLDFDVKQWSVCGIADGSKWLYNRWVNRLKIGIISQYIDTCTHNLVIATFLNINCNCFTCVFKIYVQ